MKHLDEFEQRMEQAAQEVRQSAKHAVPPPLETGARRTLPRGWLIFAAAFGVVIVTLGVLPMISTPEDSGPASGSTPSTTPAVASTTVPEPVTTAPATVPSTVADDCSAAGLPMPAEQEGLPAPVADARTSDRRRCDCLRLRGARGVGLSRFRHQLRRWRIREHPDVGGRGHLSGARPSGGAVRHSVRLRGLRGPTASLLLAVRLRIRLVGRDPPADMEALLTVYTQEELDQSAEFGAYALWRIGITETGEWRFFVAGD